MKQVVIEIPDDKDIKWIDNVLTLVDKGDNRKIKTYNDLIRYKVAINGYRFDAINNTLISTEVIANNADKNLPESEKVAKAILAMAQISQLMPYYGGEVTELDWNNEEIRKYYITKRIDITTNYAVISRGETVDEYYFLAFYSRLERDLFLENNGQLVYDYLMCTVF